MSITVSALSKQDEAQRGALVERLFHGGIAVLEMLSIYVGDRLGLYRALAEHAPLTTSQLARSAGIHERYAREWLEQQAVAGLIAVTTDNTDGAKREYGLAPGHAEVLLNPDSLNYLLPIAWAIPGVVGTLPALLTAYRVGGGVPYIDYGPEFRNSIASLNRPMFLNQLGADWVPPGCQPCAMWIAAGARSRRPKWLTSVVEPVGPASRSRKPTQRCGSMASISTSHRSQLLGRMR